MLSGKKIVIGITAGIAAYKIPFLIRHLIKEGADVRVIMTPAAKDFVTPLTLSALSRNPVVIDPFNIATGEWNSHVELGSWADIMLFAPVTANTLGKMAHGIADNFLVTTYLSAKCPVVLAPAMDLDMFRHPTTRENIRLLTSFGNHIIEPTHGELASGLTGRGRMEEPEVIFRVLTEFLTVKQDLAGKRILVTAGPTYEAIDPVRYIANHSTGRQGFAIAEEAAGRGAEVTLITGPTVLTTTQARIKRINVVSSAEMHEECRKNCPSSDIIIMTAAVSDFRTGKAALHKIKKTGNPLVLNLEPVPDILEDLGKMKRKNQVLVGFALETEQEESNARKKLKKKNLDFIVLNSLSEKGAGFGHTTNKVTIINKSGKLVKGSLKDKRKVAKDIIDLILS